MYVLQHIYRNIKATHWKLKLVSMIITFRRYDTYASNANASGESSKSFIVIRDFNFSLCLVLWMWTVNYKTTQQNSTDDLTNDEYTHICICSNDWYFYLKTQQRIKFQFPLFSKIVLSKSINRMSWGWDYGKFMYS